LEVAEKACAGPSLYRYRGRGRGSLLRAVPALTGDYILELATYHP
jgi:hypothetical protein